ncbi:MAG: hypothetical protein ACOYM2_17695, partial [Rectinemataceae bacterium]
FSCPSCSSCYPVLFSSSSMRRKGRQDNRIGRINRKGKNWRGQTQVCVRIREVADPVEGLWCIGILIIALTMTSSR